MNLQFGDLRETNLIDLAVKASETNRRKPRITDQKAVEIISMLGTDIQTYDNRRVHETVIARILLFDRVIRNYLRKYPDAVVLNLGCGFDDRFTRLDNGQLRWYNIDQPGIIAVREKVFPKRDREFTISGSLLSEDWSESIPKDGSTLVIAEGLLMYFREEQIVQLLGHILWRFSEGYLICELVSPGMVKKARERKRSGSRYRWGIKDGSELETLCAGWTLAAEESFSAERAKYSASGMLRYLLKPDFNDRLAVYQFKKGVAR